MVLLTVQNADIKDLRFDALLGQEAAALQLVHSRCTGSLPVQRCLWPWLEPVNDSGVDGGQEALTPHTEVGSYRAGCKHHVQVVTHLKTAQHFSLNSACLPDSRHARSKAQTLQVCL